MGWKNYEPWRIGDALISDDGHTIGAIFEMGTVTTGRQRVFHRYYIRVYVRDGSEFTGEDPYQLKAALSNLDHQLRAQNYLLLVAGLDPRFSESGLSFNSGFGYLPEIKDAVHMMDIPPPSKHDPENEEVVEAMIREAVDGMFCKRTQR